MNDIIQHRKVRIRKTHPFLYRSIMAFSLMDIALAVNFWTSNPTFNPYNIPKNWIGVAFFVLGAVQFVYLNVIRDLRLVRFGIAMSIFWTLFWGLTNAQQFFNGKASLQLPILYVTLAILQVSLLIESPVNLTTEKEQSNGLG